MRMLYIHINREEGTTDSDVEIIKKLIADETDSVRDDIKITILLSDQLDLPTANNKAKEENIPLLPINANNTGEAEKRLNNIIDDLMRKQSLPLSPVSLFSPTSTSSAGSSPTARRVAAPDSGNQQDLPQPRVKANFCC